MICQILCSEVLSKILKLAPQGEGMGVLSTFHRHTRGEDSKRRGDAATDI